MKRQANPSDWIILGAGFLMLIGSILPFVELEAFGQEDSSTAWDSVFPLSWWPVLLGVAMAVVVALELFSTVRLPERVISFTWNQIHVVLGFYATVLMVAWLIVDKGIVDTGIGLVLMLVASFGLMGGAVLRTREAPAVGTGGYQPPTPF